MNNKKKKRKEKEMKKGKIAVMVSLDNLKYFEKMLMV